MNSYIAISEESIRDHLAKNVARQYRDKALLHKQLAIDTAKILARRKLMDLYGIFNFEITSAECVKEPCRCYDPEGPTLASVRVFYKRINE